MNPGVRRKGSGRAGRPALHPPRAAVQIGGPPASGRRAHAVGRDDAEEHGTRPRGRQGAGLRRPAPHVAAARREHAAGGTKRSRLAARRDRSRGRRDHRRPHEQPRGAGRGRRPDARGAERVPAAVAGRLGAHPGRHGSLRGHAGHPRPRRGRGHRAEPRLSRCPGAGRPAGRGRARRSGDGARRPLGPAGRRAVDALADALRLLRRRSAMAGPAGPAGGRPHRAQAPRQHPRSSERRAGTSSRGSHQMADAPARRLAGDRPRAGLERSAAPGDASNLRSGGLAGGVRLSARGRCARPAGRERRLFGEQPLPALPHRVSAGAPRRRAGPAGPCLPRRPAHLGERRGLGADAAARASAARPRGRASSRPPRFRSGSETRSSRSWSSARSGLNGRTRNWCA